MIQIDYSSPAGFFAGRRVGGSISGPRYKRFDNTAEALRFAIEELPCSQLRGAVLEIGDTRFESNEIRSLYDAVDYPFPRKET
ncbi:hypothetical protein [Affinirhizobium pseudoryzae]|uniref:hypothetical protein n=1 Tax=Allorhizobium pseudoryzae TaxID=379684 RepID=UPI0013EDC740|nr:hypothetical protein [Allorhizobium pseudoryzae]